MNPMNLKDSRRRRRRRRRTHDDPENHPSNYR